jgi:hypothetical protein
MGRKAGGLGPSAWLPASFLLVLASFSFRREFKIQFGVLFWRRQTRGCVLKACARRPRKRKLVSSAQDDVNWMCLDSCEKARFAAQGV